MGIVVLVCGVGITHLTPLTPLQTYMQAYKGWFLVGFFPALQYLFRVTAKPLVLRLDMLRDVDGPGEP